MSTGIVADLASWLATYLLHSTLLLLGALLVTRRLRDPAARERVWKVALTASLFTVSLAQLLPAAGRPVFDLGARWQAATQGFGDASPRLSGGDAPTTVPAPAPDTRSPSEPSGTAVELASSPVAPEPGASAWATSPASAFGARLGASVVGLWLLGACVLLARRALALRRLGARLASRRSVREGAVHALLVELCSDAETVPLPRLSLVEGLSTPLVLGGREICLPRRVAEELPRAELAAILAHEVAHVRRRDPLWLRLCGWLECVLFVQPLNRVARRRLFEAAEMLCDDWAGEHTGARLDLAQGLATVARWSRAPAAPLPLPCLGGERSALVERVERLLSEPAGPRRTVAVSAGLAGVLVALACVGPAVQVHGAGGRPDFEALGIEELAELGRQASALMCERLLALPADWQQRFAEPLAVPGTQAVRLLRRDLYELPPKRGGGAYYSFATEDHDYNREPDLQYHGDSISTGFYGGTGGHVLDLGPVPLADVGPDAPPPGLLAETAQTYAAMLAFRSTGRDAHGAYREAVDPKTDAVPAIVGHSYLLRAILPGEHDHLVAFTIVEVSPDSLVLVGRVLESWPVSEPRSKAPRVGWSFEGAPSWLLALDDASLVRLQADLARQLDEQLLAVPESVAATTKVLTGGRDGGLARLVQRGRFEWVVGEANSSRYFSFVTGSHSYLEEPDLRWEDDTFKTRIKHDDRGALLDLGDVALASLDPTRPPQGLAMEQRASWATLTAPSLPASPSAADRVPARMGHTYLLRSVVDEHDVLAAFRPVQQDEHGMTIAWRVLQRYDG